MHLPQSLGLPFAQHALTEMPKLPTPITGSGLCWTLSSSFTPGKKTFLALFLLLPLSFIPLLIQLGCELPDLGL